jgi:hypothetical protein
MFAYGWRPAFAVREWLPAGYQLYLSCSFAVILIPVHRAYLGAMTPFLNQKNASKTYDDNGNILRSEFGKTWLLYRFSLGMDYDINLVGNTEPHPYPSLRFNKKKPDFTIQVAEHPNWPINESFRYRLCEIIKPNIIMRQWILGGDSVILKQII